MAFCPRQRRTRPTRTPAPGGRRGVRRARRRGRRRWRHHGRAAAHEHRVVLAEVLRDLRVPAGGGMRTATAPAGRAPRSSAGAGAAAAACAALWSSSSPDGPSWHASDPSPPSAALRAGARAPRALGTVPLLARFTTRARGAVRGRRRRRHAERGAGRQRVKLDERGAALRALRAEQQVLEPDLPRARRPAGLAAARAARSPAAVSGGSAMIAATTVAPSPARARARGRGAARVARERHAEVVEQRVAPAADEHGRLERAREPHEPRVVLAALLRFRARARARGRGGARGIGRAGQAPRASRPARAQRRREPPPSLALSLRTFEGRSSSGRPSPTTASPPRGPRSRARGAGRRARRRSRRRR